jgi:YidC/Oxa1 family membrane protein insertase
MPQVGMDATQRRMMLFILPVVMGFMLWRFAAGLSLYWATGNLISLGVQIITNRYWVGKEMMKNA